MRPWENWIIEGDIHPFEARSLLEQFDRQDLIPWSRTFGTSRTFLADGREVFMRINKNGVVPQYYLEVSGSASAAGLTTSVCGYLESGLWFAKDTLAGVLISTDLQGYFASTGDTWAWGEDAIAHGQISESTASCDGLLLGTAWSGPPALVNGELYASVISISDQERFLNREERAPFKHTGLARLAAQAIGLSRDIRYIRSDQMPTYSPYTYGIVRQKDTVAETLRYWLVCAESTGVYMVELRYCRTVGCLIKGLYEGLYTGDQARRAEASILATVSKSVTAEVYQLLIDEMASLYSDGTQPIQWGWHWSPQKWGTASEESTAAVCLFAQKTNNGAGWGYDTKRVTLTLSFSEEGPSANLTVGSYGRTGLSRLKHRLYIASGETGTYEHTEEIEGQEESSGDIYAVYRSSGPEWITYTTDGNTTTPSAEPFLGAVAACGGSSSSERQVSFGGLWRSGGFSPIGGTISYNQSYVQMEILRASVSSAGSLTWYLVNNGGSRQCDGVSSSQVLDNFAVTATCFEGVFRPCASPTYWISGEISISLGIATHDTFLPVVETSGDAGAALLLSADPTIFFTARQEQGTLRVSSFITRHTSSPGATSASWENSFGGAPSSGIFAVGGVHTTAQSGAYGGGIYASTQDFPYWDQVHIGYAVAWVNGSPGIAIPYGNSGDSFTLQQKLVMHSENGPTELESGVPGLTDEDDLMYQFLTNICRPRVTANVLGPTAMSSYSGKLIYNINIGGGWESLENDFSNTLANIDFARFIGHE